MDGIARGIASDGNTTLNIDQGGNLDINLTENTKDWCLSGALYLNSGAMINVNGNLNINSNGQYKYIYTRDEYDNLHHYLLPHYLNRFLK